MMSYVFVCISCLLLLFVDKLVEIDKGLIVGRRKWYCELFENWVVIRRKFQIFLLFSNLLLLIL